MDVSSIGLASQGNDVQAKAAAPQQQPPPPPAETDSVELSNDAKALASKSVLDE